MIHLARPGGTDRIRIGDELCEAFIRDVDHLAQSESGFTGLRGLHALPCGGDEVFTVGKVRDAHDEGTDELLAIRRRRGCVRIRSNG